MSDYLLREIESSPVIDVRYRTAIVDGRGEGFLAAFTLRDLDTGAQEEVSGPLFALIGSEPRSDWLGQDVARDRWGSVLTGTSLPEFALERPARARWRSPWSTRTWPRSHPWVTFRGE